MKINRRTLQFLSAFGFSTLGFLAHSASLNIGGNYRFGSNMFVNTDIAPGTAPGFGHTTSYLEHRASLRPDIIVDDHFVIRSEVSLMHNSASAKGGVNSSPENFGSALDRSSTTLNGEQSIYLRRMYLEWSSDWGLFKFGRQPKSWGLGILYNAGNDPMDDFGTTVDRAGFQAMLGNLSLNVGYEKEKEGVLRRDDDDSESYEFSVEYSNPETLFNVGILYARNVRSNATRGSSHDMSIFAQKRAGKFQLGGELVSIREDRKASTAGILGQIDYIPGRFNIGADVAVATAGSDGSHFTFHPNYQPFLILFRQSLGTDKATNSVRGGENGLGVGSEAGIGTGNGAFVAKGHVTYTFESKLYTLGTEFGFARLMQKGSNTSNALGFESDLHFTQKWYENFSTSYAFGLLIPGKAFGDGAQTCWGLQLRGALTF